MSIVFLCAATIMVIGLVLVFLLPELPLRQHSAAQSRVNEDAADAAAAAAAAKGGGATSGSGRSAVGQQGGSAKPAGSGGKPAA